MDREELSGVAESLLRLEGFLMDPAVRRQSEIVSQYLAVEFREFGSSGRVWGREEILEHLAAETSLPALAIEDFAVQELAAGLVLVTYCSVRESVRSNRSSIWTMREGRWQILFHQGTRVPEAAR